MTHSEKMAIIESVYRRYFQYLMLRALKYGLSQSDAEDLIMEVFQGTIKNWDGLEKKTEKGVKNYVISGVINRLKNYYRKNRYLIKAEDPVVMEEVYAEEATPLSILEVVEEKRMLLKAVEKLPEKYAGVLTLDVFEGATTKEIKQKLGISESSVKVRRYRGRKLLKKILSRDS